MKNNKSLIIGAVLKWCGHVFVLPAGSACYRCIFEERKNIVETCDEVGVIGSVCGIIGSIQATEVLKVILGKTNSEMIVFDAIENETKKMKLRSRIPHEYGQFHTPKNLMFHFETGFMVEWDEYFKKPEEYLVVDIRKKVLFEIFNLKNSINVPFCELENFEISENRKVLVVCSKGFSAMKGCKVLRGKGFESYVARGGYESLFEIFK